MSYTISIATGCYNSSEFIERTYRSLVAQEYKNLEWIVVNDGSKDNTLSLLESIAAKAAFRVVVINLPENKGAVTANSTAIQHATGDFTILFDHDDELMPGALNGLIDNWQRSVHDNTAVYGIWGRCVNEKDELLGKPINTRAIIESNAYFFHVLKVRGECLCMFRTDILKRYYHFTPDEAGSTNGLIWNRIGQQYKSIFSSLVIRRYHTNIASSMINQKTIKHPVALQNQDIEYLNSNKAFFFKDLYFFLNKLRVYLKYCYFSNTGFSKALGKLDSIALKTGAILVLPAHLVFMIKQKIVH